MSRRTTVYDLLHPSTFVWLPAVSARLLSSPSLSYQNCMVHRLLFEVFTTDDFIAVKVLKNEITTFNFVDVSSVGYIGRISEWDWDGLRSRRRGGWGGGVPFPTGGPGPSPEKFCIFCIKITRLWCTLTPFWSSFITDWKWTTMHEMLHFAILQTTKYYSRIKVKTHSTMLAIAPPNSSIVGFAQIVRVN